MAKRLHIASTLERFAPTYEEKRTHFSLLLSAWMTGTFTRDDLKYLIPPDWTIEGVRLFGRWPRARTGRSAGWHAIRTVKIDPRVAGVSLREAIVERHGTLAGKAFPATGPPRLELFGQTPIVPPAGAAADEPVMSWPYELAQFSRYPAPLPHHANLCVIFTALETELDGAEELWAAPIFSGLSRDEVLKKRCTPTSAAPVSNGGSELPDVFQHVYEDAPTGVAVVAHVNHVTAAKAKATATSIIDITSLWLMQQAGEAEFYDEDWQSRILNELAHSLDLPHVLLEAVESDEDLRGLLAKTDGALKRFERTMIALFRDASSLGLHRRPDGRAFVDDVLEGLPERLFDAEKVATIRGAVASFDSGLTRLDDWMMLLLIGTDAGLIDQLCQVDLRPTAVQAGLADTIERLRRAQRRFADADVLRIIMRKQYTEAFAGVALEEAERRALDAHVERRLADLDARPRLLQAQAGLIWNELFAFDRAKSDRDQLVDRATVVAGEHVHRRLGRVPEPDESPELGDAPATKASSPPLPGYGELRPPIAEPLPGALTILFANYVMRVTCAAITRLVGSGHYTRDTGAEVAASDASGRSAGLTAHGLSLQIDRVGNGASADDYARRLSGIGILMRRNPEEPWRCLNLAMVEATPREQGAGVRSAGAGARTVPVPAPAVSVAPSTAAAMGRFVLVPVPLIDRERTRQALVTVNNQPLVARSPAEQLAADWSLHAIDGASNASKPAREDPRRSIVTYRNAALHAAVFPQAEWARVPTLVFGESPQVALFAVGNAGLLPPEIASSTDPTSLCDFGLKIDLPHQRTVRYRRQVPIGPIRVQPERGDARVLDVRDLLPVLPEGVLPLARDLQQHASAGRKKGPGDRPPLVFLVPADSAVWQSGPGVRSSYTFGIRPPAVELNTWDRWIAADTTARPKREIAWSEVHYYQVEQAREAARSAVPTDRHVDVTLDDPALQPEGWVEIHRVGPDGRRARATAAGRASAAPFTWTANRPADQPPRNIHELRARPTPITFTASTSTDPVASIAAQPAKVDITLGPGLWEVQFWGLLARRDADARFSRAFRPGTLGDDAQVLVDDVPTSRAHPLRADVYLVAPLRFVVEVPDAAMPTAKKLRETLGFSKADEAMLQVTLRADDPSFRHVIGGELIRQVWRWDGRPETSLPESPIDRTLDSDADVQAWEVEAFGERPNVDHLRMPLTPRNEEGQGRYFHYQEDLRGDQRAHYFRWAVHVRSRYAPVMVDGGTRMSWTEDEEPWTHWSRQVVRCRRTEPLPKPAIRGVLPLTERFEGSGSPLPGVVVVMDEAWYRQAGLGEGLEVELSKTGNLHDFGPDPIVNGGAYPWATAPPEHAPVDLEVVGPVGHTFDTNTTAPLFATSSFIVRPAPGAVSKDDDLRWAFARMRFRRTLRKGWSSYDLAASEWTQPIWVQFLPDSSLYDFVDRSSPAALSVEWRGGALHIIDPKESRPVSLHPMKSSGDSTFKLYALVTRPIVDAGGRHDQEQFLGIFAPAKDGTWTPLEAKIAATLVDHEALIGRIVEVQISPVLLRTEQKAGGEKEFWDALFPPRNDLTGETPDALARIVRLSRPIFGVPRLETRAGHSSHCPDDQCAPAREPAHKPAHAPTREPAGVVPASPKQ